MSAQPNPTLPTPLGPPSVWSVYKLALLMLALGEGVYALSLTLFDPMPGPLLDFGAAWRAIWLGLLALRVGHVLPHARQVPLGDLHVRLSQVFLGLAALLALSQNFQLLPKYANPEQWDRVTTTFCAFLAFAGLLFSARLPALLSTLSSTARHSDGTHPLPLTRRLEHLPLALLGLLGLAASQTGALPLQLPWMSIALAWLSIGASAYLARPDLPLRWPLLLGAFVALPVVLSPLGDTPHETFWAAIGFAVSALAYALASRALIGRYEALPNPHHGISQTWLRNLRAEQTPGTSRLGDSAHSDDTATRDAEDLAFAYRELGIEPKGQAAAYSSSELAPLPEDMSALKPKPVATQTSQPQPLPVLNPGLPAALGALFKPMLARMLVLGSAFGVFDSPIGLIPQAKGLYGLLYVATSVWLLLGLRPLLALVPPSSKRWLSVTVAMVAFQTALEIPLALTYEPWLSLPYTSVLHALCISSQVLSVLGLMLFSLHLSGLIFEHSLEQRSKNLLGLLISLSTVLVLLPLVRELDQGELRWLAIPLSLARIGLGFALCVGLLWWTRETRESLERIQILATRGPTEDSPAETLPRESEATQGEEV